MKTFLLVDIQNDFLPGGSLEVPRGGEIIPVVNQLLPKMDIAVATQDWHPANHLSFASNHPGKKPFDRITVNRRKQTLWPDHCIQGHKGAALAEQLDTRPLEALFRKGTDTHIDSYSAFYDNRHRKSTGLAAYLREKKTSELFVGGLAGDICVYYTVLDALHEGFKVCLIRDAVMPLHPETFSQKLKELTEKGASIRKAETR